MADRTTNPDLGDSTDDGANIASVLVVGAGTMGAGIAQVVAQSGFEVLLHDSHQPTLARAMAAIPEAWRRAMAKGRLDQATVAAANARLAAAPDLAVAVQVDLVIEAVIEREAVKNDLLTRLATLVRPETILASNTSSISITRLASLVPHPERVVGLHFFNPVPVLPVVEVVRGLRTATATMDRAAAFVRRLGKTPILVADAPGFVVNRLLIPMINEAIFVLAEGTAEAAAIDEVMKLGAAHPLGPLALADLIGLDICLDIMRTLQRDLGDDKYRPAPLLQRMVDAGLLGRKSGEGFHRYGDQSQSRKRDVVSPRQADG